MPAPHDAPQRLLVFARAPIPGRCKTRLIPALGPFGAARLHRAAVLRTVALARQCGVRVELWCAPDALHPLFLACRRDFGAVLRRQPAGDLGRRMAAALGAHGGAAVLVGTDCPALAADDLDDAFAALRGAQVVLQPSRDGGYVLIGSRTLPRRVLANIRWSSGRELAQTRRRLARFGLTCTELRPLADVDTPADYRAARRAGLLPR